MLITTIVDSARTSAAAAKPPRLALRFALHTGIALLVVAVAMLWVLDRDVETRAEKRAVVQTQQVAEATLRRHLKGADFARPVTRERRAALDRNFKDVVVGGFLHATLFNRSGKVTYSTDHALIGTTGRPGTFTGVLAGWPQRSE